MDEPKQMQHMTLRHIVSFPFIMVVIFPLAILDIFVEVYHRICFRLYGITLLKRGDYIRFDRHKLSYLNPVERLFCMYCAYANGFFPYAEAIASRTEKYWCAIKHKKYEGMHEPAHHKEFAEYGDEQGYKDIKSHRDEENFL